MSTYTAVCQREGDWWVVTVPELDGHVTQARRLDQVSDAVRSLVDLFGKSADEVTVVVDPVLPKAIVRDISAARAARQKADELSERASSLTSSTARRLADSGLSVRDVGSVLGMSFQRAQQLLAKRAG